MELFTLDRSYNRTDVVDKFESAIWTERYYGDCDFQLTVESSAENFQKFPEGQFVGLAESKELMIVDTLEDEGGALKISGESLLPFMNNRFTRWEAGPTPRSFVFGTALGGWPSLILWGMLADMTMPTSPWLDGVKNTSIPNPERLAIPGILLLGYDTTGVMIQPSIPYGPLYDAMRDIATTYEVGMSLQLETNPDGSHFLGFRGYRGVNRTSGQSVNPVVKFSPEFNTLTGIKEVRSIANYKNLVFSFSSDSLAAVGLSPGEADGPGAPSGFDLRVAQTFEDDITADTFTGSAAELITLLNQRAQTVLNNNRPTSSIDGEITPVSQFKFGVDYNLGDIVEVQGNSGNTTSSRVTEYIRSQDSTGERAYPTVAALG